MSKQTNIEILITSLKSTVQELHKATLQTTKYSSPDQAKEITQSLHQAQILTEKASQIFNQITQSQDFTKNLPDQNKTILKDTLTQWDESLQELSKITESFLQDTNEIINLSKANHQSSNKNYIVDQEI